MDDWFNVQGSTFRVLSLSSFPIIVQQVIDEPTNGSPGPSGMTIDILKLSFSDILIIQRHI